MGEITLGFGQGDETEHLSVIGDAHTHKTAEGGRTNKAYCNNQPGCPWQRSPGIQLLLTPFSIFGGGRSGR
jgi:hypothetical protein